MPFLNRFISFVLAVFAFASQASAFAEKRTALVIGNSNYIHAAPLANPSNDARAMSIKLEQLGFTVVEGFDLTHAETNSVIREFSKAARESDINLLFYAGHGMAVNGVNYIVPIDARLEDETALDFEAIEVDFVTRMMSFSDSANLVFLDACRDNPLSRSLSRSMSQGSRSGSVSQGLAEMRAPSTGKGLAVAFATSPGEVALDGDGVNSPFTASLLRHIDTPNADISTVLSRVVGDVWEDTEQTQRPWLTSSLTGSVVLNPKTVLSDASQQQNEGGSAASGRATEFLDEQKLLFDIAKESGSADDYLAYLDTFPNGLFANNARRAVQRLKGDGASVELRQQASLSQQAEAPLMSNSRSAAIVETGALSLTTTATVRSLPANQYTEELLELDRQKKGEIQSRINAITGQSMAVDGLWGPGTRRGISSWQSINGIAPSGYFNEPQLELLISQSEGRFVPFNAPVAKAVGTKPARQSSSGSARNSNSGPSIGEVGELLQGAGSLLNAIKR